MASIDPEARGRTRGDGAQQGNGRTAGSAFGVEADVHGLSLGDLVREASTEASRLMRGELDLAKAELKAEVKQASKAGGAIAGGGVLAHTGYLAVVAGVILLLGLVLPLWASALIVGVLMIGAGALIAKFGGVDKLKQAVRPPERTIQTFQEDRRWASETLRNVKSNMRGNA